VKKLRILLADDDPISRAIVHEVLDSEFEMVEDVGDGKALLEAAQRLHPDIAVVDITMPVLNGVQAAYELKKLAPEIKLVMLSMHTDAAYVTESFRAGALAYVLKEHSLADLRAAIIAASQGERFVSPALRD
jgi:DNA-binding NarL/FixJ family response regulator